jgi:hypothetical protein
MKRRTIIIISTAFAIALGWSWLAKPRTIQQEFRSAGIKLDRDEVIEQGYITHFYEAPFAKEPIITDIFKKAGFSEVANPANRPLKVKYFERVTQVLFWKSHEYLTIESKPDHLEVQMGERR